MNRAGLRFLAAHPLARFARPFVKLQDFIWIALFAALIAGQTRGAPEVSMLVALAVVQVLESKVPGPYSTPGRIFFWIALKLALAYLLIGYTLALDSPYWPLMALPV